MPPEARLIAAAVPVKLNALAERWATAKAAERANAQCYLIELCHALGVEPPRPAGTGYEFEYPVKVVSRKGEEATNFVDLYKAGHFALEAKDQEDGRATDLLLRKAFGQVRNYAAHVPARAPAVPPRPGRRTTLLVWDHWSGDYGGFNQGRRIDLRTLADRPQDVDLLRAIWSDPASLDPRARAEAVTKEIAAKLAAARHRAGGEGACARAGRALPDAVRLHDVRRGRGAAEGRALPRHPGRGGAREPGGVRPAGEGALAAMDRGERFLLQEAAPLQRPLLQGRRGASAGSARTWRSCSRRPRRTGRTWSRRSSAPC